MKTLHLTLKKKWFDMIASGKKKEEYREIKPYWFERLVFRPKALNQIIAELQVQAQQLQVFEQAGEAMNSVLRTMIKTKD